MCNARSGLDSGTRFREVKVMIARMAVRRASSIALLAGIFLHGTAMAGSGGGGLSVQLSDASLANRPASALIAAPAPSAGHADGLAPAPLPNVDIDEPKTWSPPTAHISPALLSRNDVFEGNGFSNASNNDHGIDERTQPAAGLNLFVPVR
jgi:hypothetical protein